MVNVLALFAHPDDAEFLCAGTLALLAQHEASIHIGTMTPGDCGSTELPAAKIARIRRREAERSARLIRGRYFCLEGRDLLIAYDRSTLRKALSQVLPKAFRGANSRELASLARHLAHHRHRIGKVLLDAQKCALAFVAREHSFFQVESG